MITKKNCNTECIPDDQFFKTLASMEKQIKSLNHNTQKTIKQIEKMEQEVNGNEHISKANRS